MPTPPLIGLPGRRKHGNQIVGFADLFSDIDLDLYFADYARGVIAAGGIAVHLPLDVDPTLVASRLDGVLLPGGADIDPVRYGAELHPEVVALEVERDDFELALFAAALDREIPVLGICRGLQLINTFQGGTLNQHVAEHSRYDIAPTASAHHVAFDEGSALHAVYGPTTEVNSLHHQTVHELGDGLTITGRADDGCVEGLEMGNNVVAVQWHPEMLPTCAIDPVFQWLVDHSSQ